jgi:hypothetical protein
MGPAVIRTLSLPFWPDPPARGGLPGIGVVPEDAAYGCSWSRAEAAVAPRRWNRETAAAANGRLRRSRPAQNDFPSRQGRRRLWQRLVARPRVTLR